MGHRIGRILVPALVTLAIVAVAVIVFSRFGGKELAIGNLVLKARVTAGGPGRESLESTGR